MAILRRLFDDRHIPQARHRHVESAGDGGGRQCQHVDCLKQLFELFLLRHAEALLFVDNNQTEIVEFDILG